MKWEWRWPLACGYKKARVGDEFLAQAGKGDGGGGWIFGVGGGGFGIFGGEFPS